MQREHGLDALGLPAIAPLDPVDLDRDDPLLLPFEHIPASLENAMSMQAQAERERQARVILGDSERQVAEKFGGAARTYANDPVALHLRAMNMLYEGLKQNSTIVIVPSSAVESMQLGGLAGLTALTMGLEKKKNGANRGELIDEKA